MNINERDLGALGALVACEANIIFERAGCGSDFCVQHIGLNSAVFGGTNRLLWSPHKGFRADEAHAGTRPDGG